MAKVSFKDMIFKLLKKDENLGAYGGVKQNKPKSFKVKFAMPNNPNNIAVSAYQSEKDAEKFKKSILAKGGKAILTKEEVLDEGDYMVGYIKPPGGRRGIGGQQSFKSKKEAEKFIKDLKSKNYKDKDIDFMDMNSKKGQDHLDAFLRTGRVKEDAPANATGTAVVGTGDDSSTVVVKKKKRLQDKLMRRMGIQETIDRVIPDLEYPKDEIRERANQLKDLASKSKDTRAPIYKQQAKNIAKAAKIKPFKKEDTVSEGERALARDKSTDQPKKYVSGLTSKQKKSHDKHLEKQGKKSDSDKSAYKQSPADKVAKTKTSKHTSKFKKMYGEDYLNEKIKGLETKAKKSGMPYGILKKVYDRGMAAWKGGHRPGTTPQQWAFARVNSFTTKSSGTWGKADSDLAKQVRGS